MKVIWRQKGKAWEIADGRRYRDEAHLQEFLALNPHLIPFLDISKDLLPPRVMIREVGLPGSGSSDIVGIDEGGGITIIECKLATNPEIKRKVIGQVLEYAAFLWQKPYAALNEVSIRRLSKPLVEAMRDTLDEQMRQDWDEEEFVTSVTESLETGNFRLVIAVDSVTEDLRRTIEYLAQAQAHLAIYALEVAYFSSEQGEILVPHLYGPAPEAFGRTPHPSNMKRWTSERFFEDAESNKQLPPAVLDTLHTLLDFCDDEASRVYWGTGKQTGSFTFHHQGNNKTYSLFSVFSDGNLSINFGWLKDNTPLAALSHYSAQLKELPGFRNMHVREDFKNWPSVKVSDAFGTTEDMKKFQDVVLEFRDRLAEQE